MLASFLDGWFDKMDGVIETERKKLCSLSLASLLTCNQRSEVIPSNNSWLYSQYTHMFNFVDVVLFTFFLTMEVIMILILPS